MLKLFNNIPIIREDKILEEKKHKIKTSIKSKSFQKNDNTPNKKLETPNIYLFYLHFDLLSSSNWLNRAKLLSIFYSSNSSGMSANCKREDFFRFLQHWINIFRQLIIKIRDIHQVFMFKSWFFSLHDS